MIKPPCAWEAEKSLIGCVIMRPAALDEVGGIVEMGDFFIPVHTLIWGAFVELRARRVTIDLVTLEEQLERTGSLRKLDGGMAYVTGCANTAPSLWNARTYARMIREKAQLRRLIAVCGEVASAAGGDTGNTDAFLGEAFGKMSRVVLSGIEAKEPTLSETFTEIVGDIEAAERGELGARVPTGLEALDRILLGGLAPGHLVVPISETSIGKSSWAFQVAFRGAHERRIPALIFSLEMTRKEAFVKGASTIGRIDSELYAARSAGQGDPRRWEEIHRTGAIMASLDGLVTISELRSLPQIIARATAWRAEHPGPAVIVVDHLQKVRGTKGKGISREQEVSGVSQGLKDLACDLKLPVIAPAQLNDGARFEKRGPQIGDTRESKGIEHDSDVVVGIQRKREEIKGMATLRVLKHRGGRIGDVKVTWHGAWQGFEPMTTEEERWTPAAPDDDEGGPSWDSRRK